MKKLIWIFVVVAVLLLLGVAAYAGIAQDEAFLAGRLFMNSKNNESGGLHSVLSGSDEVVAEYNGHKITRNTLDYYRNMNNLGGAQAGQNSQAVTTDVEILNELLENIILREEAERLGLAATDEEVEEMMQAVRQSYEIPSGKEFIDAYCSGAGLTVDEYFSIVEDQMPATVTRQKLKDAVGKAYCEEHGIEFTKVNQPEEMRQYIENYINSLFEAHKDDIVYHLDDGTVEY